VGDVGKHAAKNIPTDSNMGPAGLANVQAIRFPGNTIQPVERDCELLPYLVEQLHLAGSRDYSNVH